MNNVDFLYNNRTLTGHDQIEAVFTAYARDPGQAVVLSQANIESEQIAGSAIAAELLISIFSKMTGLGDLLNAKHTCRRWYQILDQDAFWNNKLELIPEGLVAFSKRAFPNYTSQQRYLYCHQTYLKLVNTLLPMNTYHFVKGWGTIRGEDINRVLLQETETFARQGWHKSNSHFGHLQEVIQNMDPWMQEHREQYPELANGLSLAMGLPNIVSPEFQAAFTEEFSRQMQLLEASRPIKREQILTPEEKAFEEQLEFIYRQTQLTYGRRLAQEQFRQSQHEEIVANIDEIRRMLELDGDGALHERFIPLRTLANAVVTYGRPLSGRTDIDYILTNVLPFGISSFEDMHNVPTPFFSREAREIIRNPDLSIGIKIATVEKALMELQAPGMVELTTWTKEEKLSFLLVYALLSYDQRLVQNNRMDPFALPYLIALALISGANPNATKEQTLMPLSPKGRWVPVVDFPPTNIEVDQTALEISNASAAPSVAADINNPNVILMVADTVAWFENGNRDASVNSRLLRNFGAQ